MWGCTDKRLYDILMNRVATLHSEKDVSIATNSRTGYFRRLRREQSLECVTANRPDSAQMAHDLGTIYRLVDEYKFKYGQDTRIPLVKRKRIMDETMSGMVAPLLTHERQIADLRHDHEMHEDDPTAHGMLDHKVQVSDHATRLQAVETKLAKLPDDLLDALFTLPETVLADLVGVIEEAANGGAETGGGEDDEQEEDMNGKTQKVPPDVRKSAAKLTVPEVETAPIVVKTRRLLGSNKRVPVKAQGKEQAKPGGKK